MDCLDQKAIEAEVLKLWDSGADFESLLGFIRERGVSQAGSFLMLSRVTGMEIGRAQKVVFQSKIWADRLEVKMQIQKDLIQAIKELNEEDPNFKISFEFQPDPEESENESDESR